MGKVTVVGGKVGMDVPYSGILLNELSEGSIVRVNENGSPAEFYIACHNYESGLNGAGRTLLVRKECYTHMAWSTSNVNAFASSTVCTWLNGTYKNLLDSAVKSAIATTTFYYTPGNGDYNVTTLAKSVFLLSVYELLESRPSYVNIEGSPLPTKDILSTVNYVTDNHGLSQHTRSPSSVATTSVCNVNGRAISDEAKTVQAVRPCFTLPATAYFDEETLVFKGVA